jgi:hypothetical protein
MLTSSSIRQPQPNGLANDQRPLGERSGVLLRRNDSRYADVGWQSAPRLSEAPGVVLVAGDKLRENLSVRAVPRRTGHGNCGTRPANLALESKLSRGLDPAAGL